MNKFKLNTQTQHELIQDIQKFVLKETRAKFSEVQAAKLLHSILNGVECGIYDQLLFETRSDIVQKFYEIMGIETPPLH